MLTFYVQLLVLIDGTFIDLAAKQPSNHMEVSNVNFNMESWAALKTTFTFGIEKIYETNTISVTFYINLF